MFGTQTSTFGTGSLFGSTASNVTNYNPMKDIEVTSPPDDSVSSMAFSPGTMPSTFLAAGSWDNNVNFLIFFSFHIVYCSFLKCKCFLGCTDRIGSPCRTTSSGML